ncbi:hypothetical protein LXM94_19130 [Rhizobium sp. TRM95111]|nr:hypothetical protein [Rhizobium alarense]MCF3642085.1 hypothetical protein [Rhizobium alarense]
MGSGKAAAHAPPGVIGVMNLRGSVVPVIDPAARSSPSWKGRRSGRRPGCRPGLGYGAPDGSLLPFDAVMLRPPRTRRFRWRLWREVWLVIIDFKPVVARIRRASARRMLGTAG